eukprot:5841091-Pyramimonas_sp.AAC.1
MARIHTRPRPAAPREMALDATPPGAEAGVRQASTTTNARRPEHRYGRRDAGRVLETHRIGQTLSLRFERCSCGGNQDGICLNM